MIRRYKELWFGLSFGLGAVLIDAAMHAQMSRQSFMEELLSLNLEMAVYRILFLGFGLSLGWLLWRNNRQEREFRAIQSAFRHLRAEVTPVLVMNYSRIQVLFLRPELSSSSEEVQSMLRALHADIRKLQMIFEREELPVER